MMKKLIFITLALLTISCSKHNGYKLTGNVPEAWEGKLVLLSLNDINKPRSIDSTKISNGEFVFQGKFDIPRYCNVVVYLDSNDRKTRSKVINFSLFIDSTAIEATCDNSGRSPVFTVASNGVEADYQAFMGSIKPLEESRSKASKEYRNAYYQEMNLDKAIELARESSKKATQIREAKIDYLKKHPGSAISLKLAKDLINKNSDLSLKEIEEIFSSLTPKLQNSEMGVSLREMIDSREIFIGDPFIDHELVTPDGSKKKISHFVKPGHTTLIEFWASWCAPCRSEIPYLLNSYNKYNKRGFNILSISIDSDKKSWLKALKEEKLPWEQLLDQNSIAFKKYNLTGVPSSILVDENGKIIMVNARGGWLDNALKEIYN